MTAIDAPKSDMERRIKMDLGSDVILSYVILDISNCFKICR